MIANLSDLVAEMDEEEARNILSLSAAPRRPVAGPANDTRRAVLLQRVAYLRKKVARLQTEALRLARPLPHMERFHASRKQIIILSGANQSSKTFHALLEAARALTGQDPYNKYPKKDGRAIFCGYDNDHLSDPLYRKLFLAGEFRLIRDEHTRKWRAVRPDPDNPRQLDPYDLAYQEQWKDAPPLIPEKMVAEVAWEVASKQIPRNITLTNGWRILWRSSNSRPPRGRQVDFVLLDEDLRNTDAWVNEMIPRLLKRRGKMLWAATAQEGGPELITLCDQADQGSPHIDFYRMLIVDNPHITDDQRKFLLQTLTSEDEVAVRFHGENAAALRYIYKHIYDPNGIHGCEPFQIPTHEWARYVILDPGRQHCGSLFLAVDPQEKHRYVYDAIDIRHGDATGWAHEAALRQGSMRFEAFVVDQQMGKQTHVGREKIHNVAHQYWHALKEAGVVPRRQGSEPRLAGFFPGTNDVASREEALLNWMQPRGLANPFAGSPVLQVMRGISPKLDKQINLAQVDSTKHKDKRQAFQEDLLVCLEYAAAFNPGFHPPVPTQELMTPRPLTVPEQLAAKREHYRKRRVRSGRSFGHGMTIGG
jgi:hypothetical protein